MVIGETKMFEKARVVLSFEDRKKFAALFMVLMKVEKENVKKKKAKKKSKAKLKSQDIGPANRRSYFFSAFA